MNKMSETFEEKEMKKETNLEHYRAELEDLIKEARRTEDCIAL